MIKYRLIETSEYAKWFFSIKDKSTKQNIDVYVQRLAWGNFGNTKHVGNGVFELRMHFGPGYRVYFATKDSDLMILALGGNKSGQQRDIERAKIIWREFERRLEEEKND
jgi:putative addiction module killer protein